MSVNNQEMLRRVLVPFSELFILLALMFLALFFISASLGGEGDELPEDDLYVLKVDWGIETTSIRLERKGLGGLLRFGVLRVAQGHSGSVALSAQVDEALKTSRKWFAAWTEEPSLQSKLEKITYYHDDSGCHRLNTTWAAANRHSFSHDREDRFSSSAIIRSLAAYSNETKISISSDVFKNSIETIDETPARKQYRVDTSKHNSLVISFRPDDIQRSILLQFIVFPTRPIGGGGLPVGFEEAGKFRNSITYSFENIAKEKAIKGVFDFTPDKLAEWHEEGSSSRILSAATHHMNADCSDAPILVLHVSIEPEDVSFFTRPPEIFTEL